LGRGCESREGERNDSEAVSVPLRVANFPHDISADNLRLNFAISVVYKLEQQLREMYGDSSEDSERASSTSRIFSFSFAVFPDTDSPD
jgi:hypothetical protein